MRFSYSLRLKWHFEEQADTSEGHSLIIKDIPFRDMVPDCTGNPTVLSLHGSISLGVSLYL